MRPDVAVCNHFSQPTAGLADAINAARWTDASGGHEHPAFHRLEGAVLWLAFAKPP